MKSLDITKGKIYLAGSIVTNLYRVLFKCQASW